MIHNLYYKKRWLKSLKNRKKNITKKFTNELKMFNNFKLLNILTHRFYYSIILKYIPIAYNLLLQNVLQLNSNLYNKIHVKLNLNTNTIFIHLENYIDLIALYSTLMDISSNNIVLSKAINIPILCYNINNTIYSVIYSEKMFSLLLKLGIMNKAVQPFKKKVIMATAVVPQIQHFLIWHSIFRPFYWITKFRMFLKWKIDV